jgi:DNA invertase Pin-like site-specific DNA recombinase
MRVAVIVSARNHLARSIGDLQDVVRAVKASGASLKATEQPIDTSTAAGKCFVDMLGVFAGVRDEPAQGAPA